MCAKEVGRPVRPRQAAYLSLLIGLALAATPLRAEQMTWFIYDYPPAHILINGKPTTGIIDTTLKLVIAHWPEADHRFIVGNISRAQSDMVAGKPQFQPATLKGPDLEEYAYFRSFYPTSPQVFITQRARLAQMPLNNAGEIRMPALLKDIRFKGLLMTKRNYGETLDTLFIASSDNGRINWLSISRLGQNAAKMITLGRADWTIELETTWAYQQNQDAALRELVGVPIEGVTQLLEAGFACPRTPWGKTAIERIDRILRDPEIIITTRDAMLQWLTDDSQQRYASEISAYFQRQLDTANKPQVIP